MSCSENQDSHSRNDLLILNTLKSHKLSDLQKLLDQEKLRSEQLNNRKNELQANRQAASLTVMSTINTEVDKIVVELNNLKKHVSNSFEQNLPQRLNYPEVYQSLVQLSDLEKSSNYLHLVNYVRTSSEHIYQVLDSDLCLALDVYEILYHIRKICLGETACLSLKSYCSNIVLYWEKEFAKRLSKDFEVALDGMGWPLRVIQATPTEEQKQNFQKSVALIVRFSKLQLEPQTPRIRTSPILVDYKDPSLPIHIMVKPLKKRFQFNYFGNNTTSKESKPEIYFSQVKYWIRDLVPFLKTNLEPFSLSLLKASSIVEFIGALSELLIVKANIQLSECAETMDNITFAKILEESIVYENEMGQVLRDSVEEKMYMPPFVGALFSQPEILKHWLNIEKMACQEKLDEMFSSPSAWDRAVVPGPPEVVHLFLALLRFITGRFFHLPQPSHKIQFLQLLVNMVDDFRYRCLQIYKSRNEKVQDISSEMLFDYVMADALWHVQLALETWEDLPLFASLSSYLENLHAAEEKKFSLTGIEPYCEIGHSSESRGQILSEADENSSQASIGTPNRGLFSKVRELYDCLGEEILHTWLTSVMDDIGESILKGYVTKKWQSIQEKHTPEFPEFNISKELLLPLQKLSSLCKIVEQEMSAEIAVKWLKTLAVTLDDVLLRKLITASRFPTSAIQQLKHDFINGLFPIFSLHGIETSIFFTGITCAIKLWNMPVGDALLILDDLTNTEVPSTSHEEILAELEITLKPSQVLLLLSDRADLNTNTF